MVLRVVANLPARWRAWRDGIIAAVFAIERLATYSSGTNVVFVVCAVSRRCELGSAGVKTRYGGDIVPEEKEASFLKFWCRWALFQFAPKFASTTLLIPKAPAFCLACAWYGLEEAP